MSNRLDTERQERFEPKIFEYAWNTFLSMGYSCIATTPRSIQIIFNGETVTFFPYSGWHTGKSIKDGKGLQKLLDQIKIK